MIMKKVFIQREELNIIEGFAKNAQLGGKSNIRTFDRIEKLKEDQLTAQLGEAALSKLITGSIGLYIQTRQMRDKTPWKGDGGTDLIGYKIDVKTSRARRGLDFPYHLWVREREYNPETIYYLAIVPADKNDVVYFLGWAQGKYFGEKKGDRYELSCKQLNPMTAGK
jgi:hypothetical protein